jgi:LmbE family N-acetylglucosaminyl deacetylase
MSADIPQLAATPAFEAVRNGQTHLQKRGLPGLFMRLLALCSTEVPSRELARPALVFSPHPDDECLGCGGTIIKKKQAGASVKIVHMTDGTGSHPARLIPRQELRATRAREARNAAAVLGADDVYFLDFKDQGLGASIAPATEQVAEILRKEQPEQIFMPYRREPKREAADHIATTNIVWSALRSYRGPGKVMIWEYPVWFWLQWPWVGLKKGLIERRYVAINSLQLRFGLPAFLELRYAVNISEVLERKIAALSEHRTQMTEFIPNPEWTTLGKLLGGQFLECFHLDHVFFRWSVYEPHA